MSEVSALSGGGGGGGGRSVGEGPTGRGSQSKVHRAGPDTTVIPKFDSSSALLLRFRVFNVITPFLSSLYCINYLQGCG